MVYTEKGVPTSSQDIFLSMKIAYSVSRHTNNQTESTVPQNQDLGIVDIKEMPTSYQQKLP
jgi:hypothetical protein